jgi:hypothetical protein
MNQRATRGVFTLNTRISQKGCVSGCVEAAKGTPCTDSTAVKQVAIPEQSCNLAEQALQALQRVTLQKCDFI